MLLLVSFVGEEDMTINDGTTRVILHAFFQTKALPEQTESNIQISRPEP